MLEDELRTLAEVGNIEIASFGTERICLINGNDNPAWIPHKDMNQALKLLTAVETDHMIMDVSMFITRHKWTVDINNHRTHNKSLPLAICECVLKWESDHE